jgi:hypothetical protein
MRFNVKGIATASKSLKGKGKWNSSCGHSRVGLDPVDVAALEVGPVVVGRAGFEPATNGLKVRCSTG